MTTPSTLASLNLLTREAFVAALAGIYEHSPWIAERAYAQRPFNSVAELHAAMQQVVTDATPAEQLGLLRAHPELAGTEAATGTLTAHSTEEQQGAGLTNLSAAEHQRMAELNRLYREKFGFPCIIAVKHHTRASLFAAFERRVQGHDVEAERQACLRQVAAITRLRLEALVRP